MIEIDRFDQSIHTIYRSIAPFIQPHRTPEPMLSVLLRSIIEQGTVVGLLLLLCALSVTAELVQVQVVARAGTSIYVSMYYYLRSIGPPHPPYTVPHSIDNGRPSHIPLKPQTKQHTQA